MTSTINIPDDPDAALKARPVQRAFRKPGLSRTLLTLVRSIPPAFGKNPRDLARHAR
jgi:hypothetical protein